MSEKIPISISLLFAAVVLGLFVGILLVLRAAAFRNDLAAGRRRRMLVVVGVGIGAWLLATGMLAWRGFFADFESFPPHMAVAIVPPTIFLVILFANSSFRAFLRSVPKRWLVEFQTFRIVVEIVLWMLFANEIIPEILTFEGQNFDLLVGVSAPLMGYFAYRSRVLGERWVVLWNVLGLALLMNVVVTSALTTPGPIGVIEASPPNTLIAHLPFVWLPSFVVPTAIAGHIASIIRASDA